MDRNIEWVDLAYNWLKEHDVEADVTRALAELLEEAYTDGYADGIEHNE